VSNNSSINGTQIPGDSYKESIVTARAKSSFRVVQSQEILASHDADKTSGGSVAHFTVFSVKDKETGDERQESTLTVVTCAQQDGKVVLKELTEVYHK
jgi:Tfp pilus assembly major pilin PilA